jgi:hypothetical protein
VKPQPKYDFPINVWPEAAEYVGAVREQYADIYSVTLNHAVSIQFVPSFQRMPWPPELPVDFDTVTSLDEARRGIISLSTYSVTPDDGRRGTDEVFEGTDQQRHVVFYASNNDYASLALELSQLSDRFAGIHDALPISQLNRSRLACFILDRFLGSSYVAASDLRMLERGDQQEGLASKRDRQE